jgi:hypothetical protein
MKIRNGFVSNSSSSSFILKLPHYPSSYEDMKKMLLGDEDPLVLTHYDDTAFPTRQVIEIIYRDVIDALGKSRDNSVESVSGEEFAISEYSLDEYDNKITSSNKEEYNSLKRQYKMIVKDLKDAYSKRNNDDFDNELINNLYNQEDEIGNKMGELIIKSIKEKSLVTDVFATLSYSDNDGALMSFIEHGDILNPIMISRISHH